MVAVDHGPLAVLGGLWNWLSADTFAPILILWSAVTGSLALVLATDSNAQVQMQTRRVAEARDFLAEYVRANSINQTNVTDVAKGRRG